MTPRLRLHAVGIAALALAFASAGESAARAGDGESGLPTYRSLPSGHVTTMPASRRPTGISGREQVPGIFVAAPRFSAQTPARARHVSVVGTAGHAAEILDQEGADDERDRSACFADSPIGSGDEDDPDGREWTLGQSGQVNVWPRSQDNDSAGVTAVHREQVVRQNGATTLESVDAWVDPSTRGARLIARASLPLVRVGHAVGGVEVYAGRDDRPDGARYVQYVVVRPISRSSSRLPGMMGARQDGNSAQGNDCGHLRMPLAVEPGDGDTAAVLATVELPEPRAARQAARDAPADDAPQAGSSSNAPRGVVGLKAIKTLRRKLARHGRPPPPRPAGAAPAEPVEREVRTREMQVHLGVSQSSRDEQPLLSVSFGWSGREQVQRVVEEPPAAPDEG